MVMDTNDSLDEAERQAKARSHALMLEFLAHKEEFTAVHPEHVGEDQKVFEAWAIQKIAGLQLSVEHLAEQFNRHFGGHKQV